MVNFFEQKKLRLRRINRSNRLATHPYALNVEFIVYAVNYFMFCFRFTAANGNDMYMIRVDCSWVGYCLQTWSWLSNLYRDDGGQLWGLQWCVLYSFVNICAYLSTRWRSTVKGMGNTETYSTSRIGHLGRVYTPFSRSTRAPLK